LIHYLAEISSINSKHEVHHIKEVPDSEFQLIKNNLELVDEVQHLMDLFVVVKFNFDDIIQFQSNDVLPIIEEINPISDLKENQYAYLKAEINRFVNNYLSSFRMFIDHADVKLGRRFKKDSEEYKNFITLTNKAFDNNFSYRFLYKLRNFCQHCGLAITGFQVEGLTNGSSFTFNFQREYLLKEYDSWGKVVKEDLINGAEHININPVLNNHFTIVSKFSEKIHSLYESRFINALEFLNAVISDFRSDKEILIISEDIEGRNKNQISKTKFPLQLIDKFLNGSS